mmetsp:Transcript_22775/g.51338  ORF Transcript_22775/g.51338 Transcript_22775/m.51338 type:complete len:206 (-) Transcript_22775:34-651(-)
MLKEGSRVGEENSDKGIPHDGVALLVLGGYALHQRNVELPLQGREREREHVLLSRRQEVLKDASTSPQRKVLHEVEEQPCSSARERLLKLRAVPALSVADRLLEVELEELLARESLRPYESDHPEVFQRFVLHRVAGQNDSPPGLQLHHRRGCQRRLRSYPVTLVEHDKAGARIQEQLSRSVTYQSSALLLLRAAPVLPGSQGTG